MQEFIENTFSNALTVSFLNKYIKELMAQDFVLSALWVRGEISNFKNHSSGHMYFTLKDDNSLIKCVMFRSYNSYLKFVPQNGMKVIIKGYISVFERDGQYQLYAEEMHNDGTGDLHIAFEQLKKKLFDEGLFDNSYKKKLPFLPGSIGVVTSATGSVIRDIINVLSRRFYNVHIKIFPVRVQGEGAAKEISRAVKALNRFNMVDVIILARGGGSLEELWPFSEEIVARSIFESEIPVISAVGHETDYTISDFASDIRSPTPSAAAEIVMPEKLALLKRIKELNARLFSASLRNITLKRRQLSELSNASAFRHPYDKVYQERLKLDVLNKNLKRAVLVKHEREKSKYSILVGKLDALSPLAILSKGYCIAKTREGNALIRSVNDVKTGDYIVVDLRDGKLGCSVENVVHKENENDIKATGEYSKKGR
jgi:exodeoxyribonuclease VII large subunit